MISKWQLSHKKAFNLISHQGNMDFKILKYHFMLALKQSVIASIVFFFKKKKHIYFFLAALVLHCCAWTYSSYNELGLISSCGVWASHCSSFCSCKAQAVGEQDLGR